MLGIDIIEVERIERAVKKHGERFLKRIYTERELSQLSGAKSEKYFILELAAIWAAKEAVTKVLGVGLKIIGSWEKNGVSFREIEILYEPFGKPYVVLHGRAETAAALKEYKEIHISMTNIKKIAQAVAMAEKENDNDFF